MTTLHFRKLAEGDLETVLDWRARPEVSQYMYTDVDVDMDKQRAWFRAVSADDSRRDWIIEVDGEGVGLLSIVNIDRRHRRCEWAYYLASPSVRGKGVGKSVEFNVLRYVFEDLDLHKLCCEVFVSNEIVIKIHEKYGSRVEGTRRDHIWKNGEFHDIVEMGILRSDWESEIKDRTDYTVGNFE